MSENIDSVLLSPPSYEDGRLGFSFWDPRVGFGSIYEGAHTTGVDVVKIVLSDQDKISEHNNSANPELVSGMHAKRRIDEVVSFLFKFGLVSEV